MRSAATSPWSWTTSTPGHAPAGRDRVGFDSAIAEQCQVEDECDAYTAVYGDHVVEVEYAEDGRAAYDQACRLRGDRLQVLLRDRDLLPPSSPGRVDEAC